MIDAQQVFAHKQELEWISQAQGGDRQAFNHLYQRHIGKVYALCLRMLSNKEQAEDVSQEVFMQVWTKLDNFRGDSKFSTWLHSVTTNTVLSHIRKQKNWIQKVFSLEEQPPSLQELEAKTHGITDLSDIDKGIMRLPEKARLVFVLFAVEGYRHEEIAKMLEIAVGSSKSHYHRARNLLREWLQDE